LSHKRKENFHNWKGIGDKGLKLSRKERPTSNGFRRKVYQSFEQRGDAGLDLIDGLSSAGRVESPVGQRESPLFRCGFSRIY
jgi:hypothetical protein